MESTILKRKFFEFSNLKLSYLDSESKESKETILLTHANGYSAYCYRYLLEYLSNRYRVLALDFAGQGDSEGTLNFKDWFFLRDQILELIKKENLNSIIGIGHSMGGASQILAYKKNPELYKKLILFDPTVLSKKAYLYKFFFGLPIAKNASKRRAEFKSLELIRRSFKKFPAFMNWNAEVFEDYLNSCFEKFSEGYRLKCSPQMEEKHFLSPSFFNYIKYDKLKIETHVMIPKDYEVCSPQKAKELSSGNPNSSYEVNAELSHFFPFEKTEFTKSRVEQFLN
jgi:pimeloyl-ACP methyl ester carboxylesterase